MWFRCLELSLAGLIAYLLIEEPHPKAPPGLGADWVHPPPASSVPLEPHSLETPTKAPTEVLLGPSPCYPCECKILNTQAHFQSLTAITQGVYRVMDVKEKES